MEQRLSSLPAAVTLPLWCIHDILQFADPISASHKGMNLCHQSRRCEFHATFQKYFSTSGLIEKGILYVLGYILDFDSRPKADNTTIWFDQKGCVLLISDSKKQGMGCQSTSWTCGEITLARSFSVNLRKPRFKMVKSVPFFKFIYLYFFMVITPYWNYCWVKSLLSIYKFVIYTIAPVMRKKQPKNGLSHWREQSFSFKRQTSILSQNNNQTAVFSLLSCDTRIWQITL